MTGTPLAVEIVTPHGVAARRTVVLVEAAGTRGRLGVMAGHEPYVVGLAGGTTYLHGADGTKEQWSTGPGVMTIGHRGVVLVVRNALPVA